MTAAMPGASGQLVALDVLPGAVMVATDLEIVYANPAALDLFGVPDFAALVARERSKAHVHEGDAARLVERLAAIANNEFTSGSVEYRIVRPDNSVRVVDWSTRPFVLDGSPALLYSIDDVTPLATVRDALLASEAHQREVITALAEGVIVVDSGGVCSDANPSAAQLLGLPSPAALVGLHADLMPLVDAHGAPLDRSLHPLWRALDHAEHVRSQVYFVVFPAGCAGCASRRSRWSAWAAPGRVPW